MTQDQPSPTLTSMPFATRKPVVLFLRFAVLAACFQFLALASSSSPSVTLPSTGAGSVPASSRTKKISRVRNHDSTEERTASGNDQIEFCSNASFGFSASISIGSNRTEIRWISDIPSSVPLELLTRGGEQQVQLESEDLEDTDDGEEEELVFSDDDDFEEMPTMLMNNKSKKRSRLLKRRKLKFLNRIAGVSRIMMLKREDDAKLETRRYSRTGLQYDVSEEDDDRITQQSDLTRPGRQIHIVTTAALPWMTGTAVNPLLRAAYLHERLKGINRDSNHTSTDSSYVTLVIPWLELPEDQRQVYNGRVFESKKEQELYVRTWLAESANMPDAAENLKLVFYNARYHAGLGSVFAMGDIMQELPADELDVCILEEPEHLNWFRDPSKESWTKRYNYVVGIVHTNYDQYATQHYTGLWTAPAIRLMSAAMVRAYCHKVIKLSAVVQDFAREKEITSNVHGVRQEFIAEAVVTDESPSDGTQDTGKSAGEANAKDNRPWTKDEGSDPEPQQQAQVYFIGKLLWTKGLDILLEYQDYYKDIVGEYFAIDIYGSGPDQLEISRAYLGRQKSDPSSKTGKSQSRKTKLKSEVEKASKSAFVRAFTWVNRRRKKSKRDIGQNRTDYSKPFITVQDIYNDVIEVMESLPTKARESAEGIPTRLQESLDQLSADVTKVQESVKGLPSKTRRVINNLIDELSSRKTFPLPRSLYEFRRQPIPATFPGRVDHALLKGDLRNITEASHTYKIFVNPSVSEVLCTTTAEALAMGKFAIIPIHPSNEFFMRFPNCLGYSNADEFVANLQWALTHDPVPHTPEIAREFTWEAATDRFLEASAITHKEARERELLGKSKIDERMAWFHHELGKGKRGDIVRKVLGGGPASGQVKYEMTKRRRKRKIDNNNATRATVMSDDEDDSDDEMMSEEDMYMEGEGLPRKFRNSVFVRALREAIATTAME